MPLITHPSERTVSTQATPGRATAWATPRANIREEKEAYILELEMAGVRKEGLEITVENNELTIIGRRAPVESRGDLVYRESRTLDYRRVFDLDPSIDVDKISAQIEQGLAVLTLPKAESVKPRKITVA
jgi:HSP20 family protein